MDDENAGSGSTHETTPMDTSVRRSSPSYYGSPTPVSQLPDHTSGGGERGIPGKDYGKDSRLPLTSWGPAKYKCHILFYVFHLILYVACVAEIIRGLKDALPLNIRDTGVSHLLSTVKFTV